MNASKILSEMKDKFEPLAASMENFSHELSRPLRAKLLLVVNHVVAQNADAIAHLKPFAGRKVVLETPFWTWPLTVTPAGMFEESDLASGVDDAPIELVDGDLKVKMKISSPTALFEALLKGRRPPVDIEGSADFAAVFAWLSENLRWDYEKDVSQFLGDSPMPMLVEQLKTGVELFRDFLDSISDWLNQSHRK